MSALSDIKLTIAFIGDAIDLSVRDVEELNAAIEAAQRLISQSSPIESGQAE